MQQRGRRCSRNVDTENEGMARGRRFKRVAAKDCWPQTSDKEGHGASAAVKRKKVCERGSRRRASFVVSCTACASLASQSRCTKQARGVHLPHPLAAGKKPLSLDVI